ncbi:MAG: SusC/RagA family TonB-linked outer membrane protein, partial [Bacteroidaceae bacterium]|nr:SusC/RagA family TonB-linked outer membrane protein [Bacteroidaceae bacterium]
MGKKVTFVLALLLVSVQLLMAQGIKVSGVVVEKDTGEPVIGASVLVIGTSVGTITDLDGHFVIANVPSSAKNLRISYVGLKQKIVEITSNKMMVLMASDAENLGEVVVTAMGISREKKSLGYAVQSVKNDQLTRGASPSLSTALQGKLSGVEIAPSSGMPGASAKITIRGSRSFTGDNTPLYVVDGMPISSASDVSTLNSVTGSDFANRAIDIDPSDIESINVLKGQAASALYGMRASNGVVLITTKSGKNAKKGKPQVTFSTNFTTDVISSTPNLQTEFGQGTEGGYSPTESTSWGPKISDLANDATYGGNVVNSYTAGGLHQGQYYVTQRAAAGLDPWATPQVYNNVDAFFKNGSTWSNSLNVVQAFDKGHYSFSLGNSNSSGIVPSTGMERYNAKLSAQAQLNKNWSTGFSGSFISSHLNKQSGANNGVVATVYPAPASYDLAGIPSHIEGDPYTQNTYRSTGGFDGAYWAVENNKFTEDLQRFFGSAFAKYSTDFGTDNQKLDVKYQLGADSYTTNYTDLWGYGHSNGKGDVTHYGYSITELNSLLTANYSYKVSEDLNLNVLVGNEYVNKTTKYTEAQGLNFNFSGWNHINNASVFQADQSDTKYRTFGLFGNLALDYKNMLYFNVSGRNDIVSSMPHGNRSFFYPSVSLGFIFTELEALKNDILTFGKIRASYAQVGQAGTYVNSFYATPEYGGGFSSGTPITYPLNGVVAY